MSFLYGWFLWLLVPLSVYLRKREVKQRFQQNLRWAALVLLIVAMARPVITQAPSQETVQARSMIIALDLSASMWGEDIQPNRLQAAKATVKTFLEQNAYDQIALMGFTINPLLLSPPTTDHQLVATALDTLREAYILTKGTDIQKLLEKVSQLPDYEKLLILFSDGGDEVIDEPSIVFAHEHHIKILAIAMATAQGASIPDSEGQLLKDQAGNIVVSKFNNSLAVLAKESGGSVIDFSEPGAVAEAIQQWLDDQSRLDDVLTKESWSYVELYFIPTFLALMLLFLSATRFSLRLVGLLALLGIDVQADSWFDGYHLSQAYGSYHHQDYNRTLEHLADIDVSTLESQLVLAHTHYRLGNYQKAKTVLQTLRTTNPEIKQQLLYELGNCEANLNYYDKAKNYYIQALQLGEDNDTMHNLQVVIFLQNRYASKLGMTNPSSPEASHNANDNTESKEQPSSQQEDQSGSSGGAGSQQSKSSTMQVVNSHEEQETKRTMSSKAYDLINEGYIKEEKPW